MQKLFLLLLLVTVSFSGCQTRKLPAVVHTQYSYYKSYKTENNQLQINLQNPLHCPLRVWVKSPDKEMQTVFDAINPVVIKAQQDTVLYFPVAGNTNYSISFASRLGDTSKEIKPIALALPFPKNKAYRVIQANNTNYTHNSDWARYAVDFDMAVNDTICAATRGFVVGVIDDYKLGGTGAEWKPYANYITIYEPNSGLFTQYVHLVYKGSLVKIGDIIESGQPIALSGNTGQTNAPHLHFNCLVPANTNDGLKSVPFEFLGGYKSQELKNGDYLENN
ncbi:M23 family metallopeptidase [Pontibacter burrus]|uniref:M23 family metallopeptidase n=1 Tax=Pontibacter burrus TaxID=2704466 RepID=A0A6B3LV13_9BACT|nr:M23 family metallopeptidase [Pontibacter burrus]NEM97370.1 M23 family metallopeptidase [Pontibacter burrus]